jgi:hypothetical protein
MTVPSGEPATGQVFRAPSDAVTNTNGNFYNKFSKSPRFGGYNNGGNRTRALQVLHEIGHLTKDPNASGWLLPDDGPKVKDGTSVSEDNTKKVLEKCKAEIEKIKD